MIHKYKKFDMHIVLDTNSGSVHVMDELSYKLLDCFEAGKFCRDKAGSLLSEYPNEKIDESLGEINALIEGGQLFSKDWHLEMAEHYHKDSVIKAMCLHVAHDCNLSCKYCFANKGDYTGPKGLMSLEVGKKAIDFVIKSSGKRKNIEIDFFGGEPLMNFDTTCRILEYANEQGEKNGKNFRFTITTNGILLDSEKLDYINKNMSNIVLSIDGRKEVNDNMRPSVNGKGSYDLIMPKFKETAESRGQDNYYVRGTYTKHNLDFAADVLHLADEGFKQISVEPVVAPDTTDYAISESDLPVLMEQYDVLADEMLRRDEAGEGFNFFHFMIDLEGGPCAIKRMSGCGAGHEYVAVTPEGDIYPCHQFVGQEEYKMGSVLDGSIDMEKSREYAKINVYTKEECGKCWAKFYCSGGCLATSANYAGGMDKPYKIACELEKKRVECAIALKIKSILRESE